VKVSLAMELIKNKGTHIMVTTTQRMLVYWKKIQKMEADMVQSRGIAQMKAFKIGCRAPFPWEGPFPRHYNPQEKLDFMVEMLPQLTQWTEEIEAYELELRQPCQW
ncbi:hypothetical protein KI387_034683, partial [Taxus chinensis]